MPYFYTVHTLLSHNETTKVKLKQFSWNSGDVLADYNHNVTGTKTIRYEVTSDEVTRGNNTFV